MPAEVEQLLNNWADCPSDPWDAPTRAELALYDDGAFVDLGADIQEGGVR